MSRYILNTKIVVAGPLGGSDLILEVLEEVLGQELLLWQGEAEATIQELGHAHRRLLEYTPPCSRAGRLLSDTDVICEVRESYAKWLGLVG